MSLFPVDPFLSKTIISASELGCTEQVISISSLLSIENLIFKTKPDSETADSTSDEKPSHALIDFYHPRGDHLTLLNIFESFDKSSDKKNWFTTHPIINKKSMLIAVKTRDQLIGYCKKAGIKSSSECPDPEIVLKAFIKGFSSNISTLNLPNKTYKNLFSNQVILDV